MSQPPIPPALRMVRMGGFWRTDLSTPMSLVRSATGTEALPDEQANLTLREWLSLRFDTQWQAAPVSDDVLVFRLAGAADVVEISTLYLDPIVLLT